MADAIEWFAAGSQLIQALVWPVVLLSVVFVFRREIRGFIGRMNELSLRGQGFELNAARGADAASAATAAALKQRGLADSDIDPVVFEVHETVREVFAEGVEARFGGTVLWVDDRPSNNAHERTVLDTLGIDVVLSPSTDDALRRLRTDSYDAVVSDMGRPESETAGYDLLDAMREGGIDTPFVVYSSSDSPEHEREAWRRGALGSTSRPKELIELVRAAIAQSRR